MVCDNQCKMCTSKGGDFKIAESFSPPASANPGDYVTLDIPITLSCTGAICIVPFYKTIWVCLHDSTGNCITSGQLIYTAEGINITLTYVQPADRNFNGSVSIIQNGLLNTYCNDVRPITVKTIVPPAEKYSCNPNTNKCESDPDKGIPWFDCNASCAKAGGNLNVECDSANDMNIMGICVPKPVVLGAFALAAIYIFKK